MYNLSEQPVSRIIEEMSDFNALKKIAIYTVEEQFNIKDIVYEIGDLVAICGLDETTIYIAPYSQAIKIKLDRFDYTSIWKRYTIFTVEKFRDMFSLSEEETTNYRKVKNEIESINEQMKKKLIIGMCISPVVGFALAVIYIITSYSGGDEVLAIIQGILITLTVLLVGTAISTFLSELLCFRKKKRLARQIDSILKGEIVYEKMTK